MSFRTMIEDSFTSSIQDKIVNYVFDYFNYYEYDDYVEKYFCTNIFLSVVQPWSDSLSNLCGLSKCPFCTGSSGPLNLVVLSSKDHRKHRSAWATYDQKIMSAF